MAKVKQKPIPLSDFEPKQELQQEPYVPGYAAPYPPQTYNPQPYAPEAYNPETYPPEPFEPYAPQGDSCFGDPSLDPPPYSCQEVPCDRTDPVCCMDNNPPVVVAGIFSSHPASTICPCCRQIITTEVVYRVGSLTYAVSCGLCVVGCCLGCCIIPFLTNCCKDVDHYCPNCQYHIYRYKRL
ncbi:lipopolysaccharide-induced tumor necrosis factor-alpha factor homolog [Tiliqua scincoides]|uniref:lipopolysaccharide-induced tumor necrosis factor-alpha factor homolog n=1 Tax=Tiliqua scincoides TaxID=71010 RepID=UPI003461E249